LVLTDDAFTNNHGGYSAGAIYNDSTGNLTVTGSTFNGNSTGYYGGGAVYNSLGTATITNSTFYGNTCLSYGGAIDNYYGALTLINDTIDGNSSTFYGGGLYDAGTTSQSVLINTIIAGNSAPYGPDTYGTVAAAKSFNNLIGIDDASGLTNGVNGNLVGTAANPINPLLGALQYNGGPTMTQALLAGSPAINGGNNAYAPGPFDQRGPGYGRISGGTIDIGAYEVQTSDLVAFWSQASAL
jgi:large repetitive protein